MRELLNQKTIHRISKGVKIMEQFKIQIAEDINLIQKHWGHIDNHLKKNEYAFNFWVLSRIYDVDDELIPDLITEYNDKSIDCYVHFEESKELYIIQNKYYDDDTNLDRKEISDFLQTPLLSLSDGKYPKSKELQKIFDSIKNDPDYKIYLHFFLTNGRRSLETKTAIQNFNNNPPIKIKPLLRAEVYYIDDISKLYYGTSFKENINFKYSIKTKVKGTSLRILPEQYDLKEMSEGYYMLTPVSQLYFMYVEAIKKGYPLFEENIREYLGKNPINKGIINTLKDKSDRSNFFYYNNGITIICSKVGTPYSNTLELSQPQIVNGCQTVNSIFEVLNDYPEAQIEEEFKQTFVMVKVLLFDEKTKIQKTDKFYQDIVKYNNKQNSINENAFGSRKSVFEKLQVQFKERGFLLLVKPSDKNTFNIKYRSDAETNALLTKANEYSSKIDIQFNNLSDLFIPLEKLLQVYLAFIKDGYYAYTKKNVILKQSSDIYKDYSLKINENLTHDNLIRLYILYLKAEKIRSSSEDKKTPIPYYLIGFLGRCIKNKEKMNVVLNDLFGSKNLIFPNLFDYLQKLTTQYRKAYIKAEDSEYNTMIKRPIDEKILDMQIDLLNDLILDASLKKYFESLYL